MKPIVTPDGIDLSFDTVGGAVLVGLVVVAIALLLHRFLMASGDELGGMAKVTPGLLGRALLARRRGVPRDPWFCSECRSENLPTATVCCKGCGPRDDVEARPTADALQRDLAAADSAADPAADPADARGGTARRRI